LNEVLALADVVTVLRAGAVVHSGPVRGATEASLAAQIVGRALQPPPRRAPRPPGPVVLELDAVTTAGGRSALHRVSLRVHAGEIVGIAGVEGNGQRALAHAILGLEPLQSGRVQLAGRDLAGLDCAARRAAGIGWVPEDRLGEGLIAAMRLDENWILGQQRDASFGRRGWFDPQRLHGVATERLRRADVRPADPALPAAALSGGNQQKLVLGRELERAPRLLVLGQPTRGVDVGGIEFLHTRILAARDAGQAVLLVSADLHEILALADRIAVLFEGRIAGEVAAAHATAPQLGAWMTGVREAVA
jgi:simple sugar transport system ATP-binding protein